MKEDVEERENYLDDLGISFLDNFKDPTGFPYWNTSPGIARASPETLKVTHQTPGVQPCPVAGIP